jgi:MFS family permease
MQFRYFHIPRNLSTTEKRTFSIHLAYSLIEGFIAGIVVLNEFVFVKSFKGSAYNLSVLFQFSILALLFSIFFNEFLKRYRNKKKLLRYTALITRAPLLILLFFPSNIEIIQSRLIYHYIFLGIFLFYYMSLPVVYPLINLFLKSNYSHKNFGRLYSFTTMSKIILMLITTFSFGLLLDKDYSAFRYIYPVMGLLGIISIILFSFIKPESDIFQIKEGNLLKVVINSFRNSWYILKTNKPFRDFEIGFMFYGIAFMSSSVVITIFYDKALHLNYTSAAFYKNFYNIIAIIMLPYYGRLIGKIDLRKFSIFTYLFMGLMIFFVALTEFFPIMIEFAGIKFYFMFFTAYVFYGQFAASMPLLWDIGSAYFCKKEEAHDYQAIHLTLTGARGVFAPLVGITLYQAAGFFWTFMLSLASIIIAIGVMLFSLKKVQ